MYGPEAVLHSIEYMIFRFQRPGTLRQCRLCSEVEAAFVSAQRVPDVSTFVLCLLFLNFSDPEIVNL